MTEAVSDFNLGETIVFWVSGTLAVIGALGMIVSRKAVHSALFMALTMINLAVLYVANHLIRLPKPFEANALRRFFWAWAWES